jgi:hypothetical protein
MIMPTDNKAVQTVSLAPNGALAISAIAKHCLVALLFVMMVFARGIMPASAAGFDFVDVTGRAVIASEETEFEARLMALEDALYLAALQGGAKIDGFSLVTADSAIEDHFVVRPSSRILDYTITNEMVEEEHYIVSIRAAVGDLPKSNCFARAHSNATIFAPQIIIEPNTPPWSQQMAPAVISAMVERMDALPSLKVKSAITTELDPAKLQRQNDLYDYTALTSGVARARKGDYAIIPYLHMRAERGERLFRQKTVLYLTMGLQLFKGETYIPMMDEVVTVPIEVEKNTPWRTLNVLSQPQRNVLAQQILALVPNFVDGFAAKLKCQPLAAPMEFAGGKLVVPLGTRHGLKTNALAFVAGGDTPWQILQVSEAGPEQAVLRPLNTRRDQARLAGKTVEFMELK